MCLAIFLRITHKKSTVTTFIAVPNVCIPQVTGVMYQGNLTVISNLSTVGQYLSEENLRDIIKFCHSNSMLLLADEVNTFLFSYSLY